MTWRSRLRRPRTWLVLVPVLVVLVAVVGPFVYINFIEGDPPERLTFSSTPSTAATVATVALDGAWAVGDGSVAGYRVGEVLFGQGTEAVGRTSDVTGSLTISGATIPEAAFEVDLTTVTSDQDRRDRQFQGRIMDTATFPTATFRLTQPIALGSPPDDVAEVTATATGELTVRGTTRTVTFDLLARRNGTGFEVNGSIPVVFADYGIPAPSFGPAEVEDEGEIEFLLLFERA